MENQISKLLGIYNLESEKKTDGGMTENFMTSKKNHDKPASLEQWI